MIAERAQMEKLATDRATATADQKQADHLHSAIVADIRARDTQGIYADVDFNAEGLARRPGAPVRARRLSRGARSHGRRCRRARCTTCTSPPRRLAPSKP